jgi:lysozyme
MSKEQIKAQVRDDEGWDAFPYEDHLGFLTIGYGFLIDPRKGDGLPRIVAEFWLDYLVDERTTAMRRRWPPFDKQPPVVQNALLNMSYQMGVGGVLNFKKMILALERGDRAEAKRQALDSKWARQTPERAQRVADVIGGG